MAYGTVHADTTPLAARVVGKVLAEQARALGERPFVRFDADWVSFSEANRRANRTAHWMLEAGITKGARVGILLTNRLEYLDLWFGLSKIGAIQLPINTEYRSTQLLQLLQRAPIELIVTEASLVPELSAALAQINDTGPVPRIGIVDADRSSSPRVVARTVEYGRAVASAPDSEPACAEGVTGGDVGSIMNTSGTTGPSKGVLLSYAQQYIFARNIVADMELTSDDIYYNYWAFFHNSSQVLATYPALLCGARMIVVRKFSVSRFWPDVIDHRCTAFGYVGEIIRMLLQRTTPDDAGRRVRIAAESRLGLRRVAQGLCRISKPIRRRIAYRLRFHRG